MNFFEIDAWIITNGYNVGIVQLVGQAINKIKLTNPKKHITAIGLCKWGSVKDVERLTDPQYIKKQVEFMFYKNMDLICFVLRERPIDLVFWIMMEK